MKNNKKNSTTTGILSKINNFKIIPNKLYTKNFSKNIITPRQPNNFPKPVNTNTNIKIRVNILSNNEENIDINYNSNRKRKSKLSKSKGKKINNSGIKGDLSFKNILTVNRSYNTIVKKNNIKKNNKNYNSLVNSLFISHNENKNYMPKTNLKNKINKENNSTNRNRNKKKEILGRKTVGYMKSFKDESHYKINTAGTDGKRIIKRIKSNNNIKINLSNNFKNLMIDNINSMNNKENKNIYTHTNLNNIINNINYENKIEKKENEINFNQKENKISENFSKNKTNKNIEIIRNRFKDKNNKINKNINRNESEDIKKKNSNSISNKKILTKTLTKNNFENENNKSSFNKSKINMGRPSVNELFFSNSINISKSNQILSPLKTKQNISKKKISINLLGSYNLKRTNTLNFKNNNIVNSNNSKKTSALFNNKKNLLNNHYKKNKKLISNNNETNNTTGTIGTTYINKEDQNNSKILDNKKSKNQSNQFLKFNQISNLADSIETKNINNTSNNNIDDNKITIKRNLKNNNITENNLHENIKIQNINNNEITDINNKDTNDNNKQLLKKEDNYFNLLDITPNTPSTANSKIQGMYKKNKSVCHMEKVKKIEDNGELIECPLSRKSQNHPKLKDKIIIKFEDLLTFESKLNDIISELLNKESLNKHGASNECAEFMAFYFHSSLCGIFINYFNPNNKIIIHSGNNLLLLSIIITYHLSINSKMLPNLLDDIKYIFSLLKINYLLLLKKIEIYYNDEFPTKYTDFLNQKLGQIKITNCSSEIDIISKINKNCCNISERMILILNYYQRNNDKYYNELNGIFKNISTVSEKNINDYFYNYLYVNPFNLERDKINNVNKINNNYNNICIDTSKNISRICSSISSSSNVSLKGYDDYDSDNFLNDNLSYKTEKSEDLERELLSVKSYNSINYCGKLNPNKNGSTINCDNNFYYNIENNIYENDEDGTNAYEVMQMIKDYEISKVEAPFIVFPPKKKYTLVLDLDETLIHLRQKKDVINLKNDVNIKINNISDNFYENYDKDRNKYLLQFRVGLFSFLTILKPFYEIISFTSATKEYANVIINEIEKKRKFFDYNFYREHTVIYKDTFVKDISRIGRDIKKIIIIDNNEFNFVLNKENGIKIAPYYGDEENKNNVNNSTNSENIDRLNNGIKKRSDNVLLELKKILVMIYKDNYDDLREALKDYEDLIKTKVSLI